jgi:hypothetical protein
LETSCNNVGDGHVLCHCRCYAISWVKTNNADDHVETAQRPLLPTCAAQQRYGCSERSRYIRQRTVAPVVPPVVPTGLSAGVLWKQPIFAKSIWMLCGAEHIRAGTYDRERWEGAPPGGMWPRAAKRMQLARLCVGQGARLYIDCTAFLVAAVPLHCTHVSKALMGTN